MSYDGLLNITCDIQLKTETPDTTSRQVIESWADYKTNVKCRLDQAKGGAVRTPTDVYIRATHLLFIKYRTDLNINNYRIDIDGEYYTILSIRNAGGQGHHTELDLEKVTS